MFPSSVHFPFSTQMSVFIPIVLMLGYIHLKAAFLIYFVVVFQGDVFIYLKWHCFPTKVMQNTSDPGVEPINEKYLFWNNGV